MVFLRALVVAVTSKRDVVVVNHPSVLLVCRTDATGAQPIPRYHTGPRDVVESGLTVPEVRTLFQLADDQPVISCPHSKDDIFANARELTAKLIQHADARRQYSRTITRLCHYDPHKAWLLCYWVNRCIRRAGDKLDQSSARVIESLIDFRAAVQLGAVSHIHAVIHQKLDKIERWVLEVAAAWTLPWSIKELTSVITSLQERRFSPVAVAERVTSFLRDHAPFIVRAGQANNELFSWSAGRVIDDGSVGGDPRFEVPSVAAEFFRAALELRPERSKIYLEMARVVTRRRRAVERRSSIEETMLRVEEIRRYCLAGRPDLAAGQYTNEESFEHLRRANSWDRIIQLGEEILQTFTSAKRRERRHARGRRNGQRDSLEWQCRVTIIYANALAKVQHFNRAHDVCTDMLGRSKGGQVDPLLPARLHLVLAKTMRLGSDHLHALDEIKKALRLLGSLRDETDSVRCAEISYLRGRAFAARAQNEMSRGRLDTASKALDRAAEAATHTSEAFASTLNGLVLRHRGTIALLRGELESEQGADALFGQFLTTTDRLPGHTRKGIRAIAHFKRARVLHERVRQWEICNLPELGVHPIVGLDGLRRAAAAGNLAQWIEKARDQLALAQQLLASHDQGDRKWFDAIELSQVHCDLLPLRVGLTDGDPAKLRSLEELQAEHARLKKRMSVDASGPAKRDERTSEARKLELDTLDLCLEAQTILGEADSGGRAEDRERFLSEHVKLEPSERHDGGWDDDKQTNPYKISHLCYERAYYLWRLLERRPSSNADDELPTGSSSLEDVLEAIARLYRKGTTSLYRHDMHLAARPLHMLALAAFGRRPQCLQEVLEAVTCLQGIEATIGNEIGRVLDMIAVQAVSTEEPLGRYYTLPLKVICRLIGDHEGYWSMHDTGDWPQHPLQLAPDRTSLSAVATSLATECVVWCRSVEMRWDAIRALAGVEAHTALQKKRGVLDWVRALEQQSQKFQSQLVTAVQRPRRRGQ